VAVTVTQLRAAIGVEASAFDRGVAAIEGRLEKLGPKFQRMGVAMSAALTAPLVGLGARGVKVAMELEQSLNVLAATSGATGAQMAQLSTLAEKLGADIALPGTSAADAARAMLELSKGGLSVADTMASARAVLQLSAAAQIDNARAAEITADSLATFGLAGTEAIKVADLLAGAANASTGSIDEMAQALAQSGASFREMGVNITDATAAISLLAQSGIKGSDAGTSLKTMLSRLNPTTKEAKAAMDKLKISFFDANGQFVGMQRSAEILKTALGKLSQENRNSALSIIFGSDAMRAASIIARAGSEDFGRMRDQVSKAGSAADLAAAQNKGLKGALDALQSSIDTALNAAVKPFLGDLEHLAKRASELAGKFGELDEATQKSIVLGAGGAALAGPALISLGALANALRALLPVFKSVRVAAILTWATITGPLAPLILAATLAATLIWQAWDVNFMRIREATAAAWSEVKTTFSAGADAISNTWRALVTFLTGEWGKSFDHIKEAASSAMEFINRVVDPGAALRRAAGATKAAVDKAKLDKLALEVNWFPGIKEQGAQAARDLLDQRRKLQQFMQGMALIQAPKVAPAAPKPQAPHIAGLFDSATKQKLSEAEQQAKSFAQALREANTEQAMLAAGASDTAIRLANHFNLVAKAERDSLAATLARNEAMRKARQDMTSASGKVDELARKFSAMTEKTLEGRLAFELFGLPLSDVTKKMRELLRIAAMYTRGIERGEERTKKAKDAEAERQRIQSITNGLFKDAAQALDLVRDGSLENKIAWDAYGKSIRNVTDGLTRHAIIAKAQAQRFEEMAKQAKAAVVPLGNFLGFLEHLIQIMPQAPWEQSRASMEAWAGQMTTVGLKTRELQQEMSLLRDGSVENRLAFELFGTALENLDLETMEWIFSLGDLQRQIDATAAKKDALRDLAQSTQDVFTDAFGRLNEGFGGFFQGVIQGFERMLSQMASQFLASQLTNLLFGAFGGGTPGIAGPIGNLFGGARAMGGPVDAGRSYLVGERGPELFTPSQSGRIEPNSGGALRPIVVNMTVVTPDANSFRRSSGQVEASAAMALRRAERRAGGE
jgi:TP901 family phage tail tape measure protein